MRSIFLQSENRRQLSKITDVLLEDTIHYGLLRNALIELKSLFIKVSEIDKNQEDYELDIHHTTGKAIGPKWAELCIDDNLRTKQFIKGTYKAILKKIELKKNNPVTLLYIGTGPFATLLLPLTTVFKPEELQLILVEINPMSVASLKNCISNFGIENYVKEIISVDAVQLQLENPNDIDILLLECLQYALVKEQQVAITYSILPQLKEEVILIPEEIKLSLCLINSKKKMEYLTSHENLKPDYFNKKNTVFVLNKEEVLNNKSTPLEFPEITTLISEQDKKEYTSVAIATEICVYGEEKLEIDQCSLTMIYKLSDMEKVQLNEGVVTQYIVNEKPGFKVNWI